MPKSKGLMSFGSASMNFIKLRNLNLSLIQTKHNLIYIDPQVKKFQYIAKRTKNKRIRNKLVKMIGKTNPYQTDTIQTNKIIVSGVSVAFKKVTDIKGCVK